MMLMQDFLTQITVLPEPAAHTKALQAYTKTTSGYPGVLYTVAD